MYVIYPAVIHEDPDGLWAEFPDLPGCSTQGDTQEELLANASEAMECFLLGLLEDEENLPAPTSPKNIRAKEKNTYLSLIRADIDPAKNTKSVKKNAHHSRLAQSKSAGVERQFQQSLAKCTHARIARPAEIICGNSLSIGLLIISLCKQKSPTISETMMF